MTAWWLTVHGIADVRCHSCCNDWKHFHSEADVFKHSKIQGFGVSYKHVTRRTQLPQPRREAQQHEVSHLSFPAPGPDVSWGCSSIRVHKSTHYVGSWLQLLRGYVFSHIHQIISIFVSIYEAALKHAVLCGTGKVCIWIFCVALTIGRGLLLLYFAICFILSPKLAVPECLE